MDIDIDRDGPIFDGRAELAAARLCEEARTDIAQVGVDMIHTRLHEVIKRPTGYYEGHIQVDRSFTDRVINDSGIVYGPWLEGTGSRNQTTRFKGYHTFRQMTPLIEKEGGLETERLLHDRYLREMN